MTLLHCLLILLAPLFGVVILKLWTGLTQNFLKISLLILVVVCLTVFLSPLSLSGEWLDFLILILCLTTYFGWKFKSKGVTTTKLFKNIGVLLLVFIFLFLEAIASQFTGVTDISSYLIFEKVTTYKEYRLIHRKVNTNFMYSGTHLITIKEEIQSLPFLEYQVGTVNAGQHFDNAIPSQFQYLVDSKNKKLIIKSGSDTSIAY